YTAQRYFALAEEGLLSPDERVELLEGLIVAMAPQSPAHAAAVWRTTHALERCVSQGAIVRAQCSFIASEFSVPEPDVCIVEGSIEDYERVHPSRALLIVEIASSSLAPDRLTKSRIYAAAAIPQYWIVNLRDGVVESYTDPDPPARVYKRTVVHRRDETIRVVALPECSVRVEDLFPRERPASSD